MKATKEYQIANQTRTQLELPEKVQKIDESLQKDPNDAKLWMERGLALSEVSLMREAVEAYSRAIALEPFCGILYRHRGHRHLSCYEFVEASADFEMAARLIPENWDVWYHLALSYYLQGLYEKASAAYARCRALTKEDDIDSLCAVSDWWWRTLMRLGEKEKAKEMIATLPTDFDPDVEISGYSCMCALYQGRLKAEDMLPNGVDAPEIKPISMGYGLSNYYYLNGDMEKSNSLVKEIISVGEADWWCAFGYLAAGVDHQKRNLD